MEDLIKKVSYLKGYADGLDLSPKSDEGKLIIKLLDVMSEMADTIEELNSRVDDVEDVVDELDDCVLEIADDLYGDDEYDDYDDDDDDDYIDDYDDDDYDSDGNDYFEIQCPNCGEDVMIDFDMIIFTYRFANKNASIVILYHFRVWRIRRTNTLTH